MLPLSWAISVPAALMLMAGYVLDSADGQLARFNGGGTKAGQWLDHVSDALKTALFHAVIAVVWFRYYDISNTIWLLIPVAFGVVHSTFFFSIMLADDLRMLADTKHSTIGLQKRQVLRWDAFQSFLKLPNDWGLMCMTLMILPAQSLFRPTYAFLLCANTVFLLVGWVRWYRELAKL
jgi:phosphatidylglycerophosphate synthase